MKRIDYYKIQLKESMEIKQSKKTKGKTNYQDIDLIFEELNNYLPTYKEKKELVEYYNKLKSTK